MSVLSRLDVLHGMQQQWTHNSHRLLHARRTSRQIDNQSLAHHSGRASREGGERLSPRAFRAHPRHEPLALLVQHRSRGFRRYVSWAETGTARGEDEITRIDDARSGPFPQFGRNSIHVIRHNVPAGNAMYYVPALVVHAIDYRSQSVFHGWAG